MSAKLYDVACFTYVFLWLINLESLYILIILFSLTRCQAMYAVRNELVESYQGRKELINFTKFMTQIMIHMTVLFKLLFTVQWNFIISPLFSCQTHLLPCIRLECLSEEIGLRKYTSCVCFFVIPKMWWYLKLEVMTYWSAQAHI